MFIGTSEINKGQGKAKQIFENLPTLLMMQQHRLEKKWQDFKNQNVHVQCAFWLALTLS